MATNYKDLTGYESGLLTVIRKATPEERKGRPGNYAYWLCKCKCGKEIFVNSKHLTGNPQTTSCGCVRNKKLIEYNHTRLKDLTEQRFGKLVVKNFIGTQGNRTYWECLCDCGQYTVVERSNLESGHTQSCGCLTSKGNLKIRQLLMEANIPFQAEYRIEANNTFYRFDFFVDNRYMIEYDGIQHYDENNNWYRPESDRIKEQWCKDNNIPLIRVPYTKFDTLTIDDLLLKAE